MKKHIKKSVILYNIIQSLKKLKNKIKLQHSEKHDFTFLDFLWRNNFIYGFQKKDFLIIFLKQNHSGSNIIVKKLNQKSKIKKIRQNKKWFKNSFYIVQTNKGILNQNQSLSLKIGGFLICKIN